MNTFNNDGHSLGKHKRQSRNLPKENFHYGQIEEMRISIDSMMKKYENFNNAEDFEIWEAFGVAKDNLGKLNLIISQKIGKNRKKQHHEARGI